MNAPKHILIDCQRRCLSGTDHSTLFGFELVVSRPIRPVKPRNKEVAGVVATAAAPVRAVELVVEDSQGRGTRRAIGPGIVGQFSIFGPNQAIGTFEIPGCDRSLSVRGGAGCSEARRG